MKITGSGRARLQSCPPVPERRISEEITLEPDGRAKKARSVLISICGRFRGMEHTEYPNVGFAVVFEPVTGAARQVDARARSEFGITFVGPQASFPFKDVERLFVRMVVHRRATRGD